MKELLERLQDDFEYQLQKCLQEDTTENIYDQGMYDGSIIRYVLTMNDVEMIFRKWLIDIILMAMKKEIMSSSNSLEIN